MDSIFHRVSIRKFQDKPVEPEKIEKLLRAAMAAPSAGNQQPWEFYVVTNRDLIQKLSATSPYAGCAKNAPVLIVSAYREDVIFPMYAQIDLHIGITVCFQCVGNFVQFISNFPFGLLYLRFQRFTLLTLEDALCFGKLLLKLRQNLVLQVFDFFCFILQFYHQVTHYPFPLYRLFFCPANRVWGQPGPHPHADRDTAKDILHFYSSI